MTTRERLSKVLKRERKEREMSQHQMAHFLGISQKDVSYIETGNRALTADFIDEIANKLGYEARFHRCNIDVS